MKKLLICLSLVLFSSSYADTPGQVINKTCSTSQWFSAITKTAAPVCSQPGYSDLSGSVPAITSLNTLTAAIQLFGTSESGTDFTISSSGSTHTFNLPIASATKTGKLSSTDWSTFNGKQAAGNYITALNTDVVATGPGSVVATIQPGVVANSKLANMANGRFKGRSSAGTGDPEDLTGTQATALLDSFIGDSGSGGTKGLVPAPASGDASTKFLKANGSWAIPAGTGIPDVLTTRGDLLTQNPSGTYVRKALGSSGKFLQSDGTDPNWSAYTLPSSVSGSGTILRSNGTNYVGTTATYPSATTANDILFSSASNTIGEISTAATSALVTNSSNVPSFTSGSTANRLLRTNGTTISFAQADLTTDVTGVLPVANGGTNNSSAYTDGSVLFSNGTSITQDNTNLFWDRTLNSNYLKLGGGTAAGQLRLLEGSAGGINYTGFKAPATLAADVEYTLPNADGTSGQVLSTNGSKVLSWATASSGGVTSINGQSDAAELITVGTAGSDFNITQSGTDTNVLNLPDATSLHRGALTSADWSTFNGKQSTALTNTHIWVGNGSNVATDVAMSADATMANTGALTIANDAVTNAKMANMATATFKARTTAGTGDPEDLTATQATALLNTMTGGGGTGLKGLAPAQVAGDVNKFLKGDATWSAVDLSTANVTGVLPMANGGTNKNMTASAGAMAYSDADSLELTAVGSSGQIMQSAGTGTPVWTTATYPATGGTSGTILRSNGTNFVNTTATYPTTTTANRILYSSALNTIGEITSGATSALVTNSSSVPAFTSGSTANRLLRTDGTTVSFAQAALATDVSGTLPIANGGTNNSSAYTNGSIIFSNGTSLTEDNSNLFWNPTANAQRLVLGAGTSAGELRFKEGSGGGTNYVALAASPTLIGNVTWILPKADATVPGQFLASDAAGNMSWASGGTGTVTGTGTDNHVMRWDGSTAAQDSTEIIDDAGASTGLTKLDLDNLELDGNTVSTTNTNGSLSLTPNGTGQVLVPTGSNAAPGVAFSSDTNTGFAVGTGADTGRLIAGGASALLWGTHSALINEDHDGTFVLNMYDGTGATNMIYASSATGNTGFGTTASLLPQSRVDISDTTGGVETLSRRDTTATADDVIGKIQFWNNDTQLTTQNIFANIEADADQTVTTDAAAGRLVFSTTGTSAGGSPIERLRITSSGEWGLAGNNPGNSGEYITSVGAGAAVTWAPPTHGEYGTGIDGSLVIVGNTTMTSDLQLENLTIAGGVTLTTAGYRLYVHGTLTNSGTISARGNNGTAGGLGGFGGAALASGTVGGSTAGGPSQIAGTNETECYGGAGGNGGGGLGGVGGTCTTNAVNDGGVRNAYALPNALTGRSLSGLQFTGGAGGGGGANDGGNRGGGGGSGGGVLIVAANNVATLGTLDAGGGTGGAGSTGNASGGGGGAGGLCVLIFNRPLVFASPVTCAAGGVGGARAGTGTAGATGSNGRTVILRN